MGNWGGAGEECGKEGRTKGSREEGSGARVGVDGRTSERAGAVYVAYLLVHCRAILSCSALLVRY